MHSTYPLFISLFANTDCCCTFANTSKHTEKCPAYPRMYSAHEPVSWYGRPSMDGYSMVERFRQWEKQEASSSPRANGFGECKSPQDGTGGLQGACVCVCVCGCVCGCVCVYV